MLNHAFGNFPRANILRSSHIDTKSLIFRSGGENVTNPVGLSRRDLRASVTIILISILSPVAQDSREPVQFAVIFVVGRGVTGVPDV